MKRAGKYQALFVFVFGQIQSGDISAENGIGADLRG